MAQVPGTLWQTLVSAKGAGTVVRTSTLCWFWTKLLLKRIKEKGQLAGKWIKTEMAISFG